VRHKTNGQRYVRANDGTSWIVSSFATPQVPFDYEKEAPGAWDGGGFDPVVLGIGAVQLWRRYVRNVKKNGIVFLLSAYRFQGDVRWRWEVTDPNLIETLVAELREGESPPDIRLEGKEPEEISPSSEDVPGE
jgi:hypothetical protein